MRTHREITLQEFHRELKAQGVGNQEDLAFRCPMCGRIQSARCLIKAGAGASFEQVERYLAFSCVGRFTGAGSPRKKKDGLGCDWTLGGFFRGSELTVIDEDGKKYPRFEIATPEEAQDLAAKHAAAAEVGG